MPAPADHELNQAVSNHVTSTLLTHRPRVFVPGKLPQAALERSGSPPTFFYCAQLLHGHVSLEKSAGIADYKWVDKQEALELIKDNGELAKAVERIMFN